MTKAVKKIMKMMTRKTTSGNEMKRTKKNTHDKAENQWTLQEA